jgi:hypothetical protein
VDIASVIREEIVAQTGTEPVSVRPSKNGPDLTTKTRSWIVSFLREVPTFRIFGADIRSRLIQKKPPIIRHDPGCQGYHPRHRCGRLPRCANCGRPDDHQHVTPCTKPPQCANCHGPARADHENCPAKPTRKAGKLVQLTKRELAAVRRTGRQLYNEQHLGSRHDVSQPRNTPETISDLSSPPRSASPETTDEEMEPMEIETREASTTAETTTSNNQRPRRNTPKIKINYRIGNYASLSSNN